MNGMKVVLATGIYPPEIGGPATYVWNLARALAERQVRVSIIAYGEQPDELDGIPVYRVSRKGGVIARWRRYAKALREHASDADIVYAFSSVSCGSPLWLAKLKNPKKILRLGGDFLWERYTDRGGIMGLREWYASNPRFKGMMNGLLRHFDFIVFSTQFQEELYEKFYQNLALHGVIENALPIGVPVNHSRHQPFRLLFLGRFVSFKNLGSLILALKEIPDTVLTIAGEGPLEDKLQSLVAEHELGDRVTFLPSQSGDSKQQLFLDHDLLVLPSYTELSPNTALEARAAGLPVLLTEETGLSRALTDGTHLRALRSSRDIINALRDTMDTYELLAERASSPVPSRTWDQVAEEHMTLFRNLL
jgi:glycosyltransferase involved in cell wall biosynthesis